jgi:hypothetical protein
MVTRLLALLTILFAVCTAHASDCINGMCPLPTQRSPVQKHNTSRDISLWKQVCRISVQLLDGTTSLGSGVWCAAEGRQPAVLSAAHVVRGAASSQVVCYFPHTGESIAGRVFARDNNLDIISIQLDVAPRIKPAKISDRVPTQGDSITLTGMGGSPRKGFLAVAARATQWLMARSRDTVANLLAIGAPSSQGDSGGPAWDEKGRVAGIITASNNEFTVIATGPRGSGLESLRQLLPPEPQVQQQPDETPQQSPNEDTPVAPVPDKEPDSDAATPPQSPVTKPPTHEPEDEAGQDGDDGGSSVAGAAADVVSSGFAISRWTALAAALGFGGPIGLGIGVAGWLISRRVKERIVEHVTPSPEQPQEVGDTDSPFLGQRDISEAKQMLRMANNVEGRNSVLDALAGRIALDRLSEELDSSTASEARKGFARDLKDYIYRVIDQMAPLAIRRAA